MKTWEFDFVKDTIYVNSLSDSFNFVAYTILNLFWEGYCINFCLISLDIVSRIHLT